MTGWFEWCYLLAGDAVWTAGTWWRIRAIEGGWLWIENPANGAWWKGRTPAERVWARLADYRPETSTQAAMTGAVRTVQNVLGGREISWWSDRRG